MVFANAITTKSVRLGFQKNHVKFLKKQIFYVRKKNKTEMLFIFGRRPDR